MKWTITSIMLLSVAAGCMSRGSKSSASMYPNGSALDITAPPAPPMQYQPAPVAVQPVYDTSAQPVSYASAAGGRYTVKKGDTLWKIAETKYGNGNQWQKIASANPGLSAETLKAGQTIAVP